MCLQRSSKKRNAVEWIIPAIIMFFYANTFYFRKTVLKDAKVDYSYNAHNDLELGPTIKSNTNEAKQHKQQWSPSTTPKATMLHTNPRLG